MMKTTVLLNLFFEKTALHFFSGFSDEQHLFEIHFCNNIQLFLLSLIEYILSGKKNINFFFSFFIILTPNCTCMLLICLMAGSIVYGRTIPLRVAVSLIHEHITQQ